MMKTVVTILMFIAGCLIFNVNSLAQCAMCRASVENSMSQNSESFSAGLNVGILYLFVMPYLLVVIIAILWYRSSNKNDKSFKISIRSGRKMP